MDAGTLVAEAATFTIVGGPRAMDGFGYSLSVSKIKKISLNSASIIVDTGDGQVQRPLGYGMGPVRAFFNTSSLPVVKAPYFHSTQSWLLQQRLSEIRIFFTSAAAGQARIAVYNSNGKVISVLFDGYCPAGPHSVQWSRIAGPGHRRTPGIFFIVGTFNHMPMLRQTIAID